MTSNGYFLSLSLCNGFITLATRCGNAASYLSLSLLKGFEFRFGIVCIAWIYIGILNYIIVVSYFFGCLVTIKINYVVRNRFIFFDGNCCLHRVLNCCVWCVCLYGSYMWVWVESCVVYRSVYRSVTSTPSVGHNCPRRKCERDGLLGCCCCGVWGDIVFQISIYSGVQKLKERN